MVVCVECGKKLGIVIRFFHPILGRTHFVCGNCCLRIEGLLQQWRTFVLSNPTLLESLKIDGTELIQNFEQMVGSVMNDNSIMTPMMMNHRINIKNYDSNNSVLPKKSVSI